MSYKITHVWNLIKNDINEFIHKTETNLENRFLNRFRKQIYGYQRGNMVGEG